MTTETTLQGSCHCGCVTWTHQGMPESATACNCTVCRRYGVLWAYDYEGEGITVVGPTTVYVRGDCITFHFCPSCGCVVCWKDQELDDKGRRRIAVNLRLTEPDPIAQVPMRHFEGLNTFTDLPQDFELFKGTSINRNFVAIRCCRKKFLPYISNICAAENFFCA
jgi:hypothetical protein